MSTDAAAEFVMYKCRNTRQAVFVVDKQVLCTPVDGKRFNAALRDWPDSLMGCYDSRIDRRDLMEDLRWMGVK